MANPVIWALHEKRMPRSGRAGVLVLARVDGALLLQRRETDGPWSLPSGETAAGEDALESARRVLGEAMGEAEFDVTPLCAYQTDGPDGRAVRGRAFLADVYAWPDREHAQARAFEPLPPPEMLEGGALARGLRRFAGEFFDPGLAPQRLGQIERNA